MYERIKCNEYDTYLHNHINGVIDSYNQFIRPNLDDLDLISICDEIMPKHDMSKWDKDEYDAYAHYFYIDEENMKNQLAFDYAWLIHQHKNPHHHQHWVLIRDEGEKEPLDMPEHYVIEMLCDWSSFSKKDPSSTAFKWWNDNQDNMVLSEKTKKLIELYIQYLKEPLT